MSAILTTGGGLRYFTNAWICIKMVRALGCRLPIELWMLPQEHDTRMTRWLGALNVELRIADELENAHFQQHGRGGTLPRGTRAQWILKVYAMLASKSLEFVFLDADNVPLIDPAELLKLSPYQQTGSIFWPDFTRMGPEREIWKIMGVQYRDEPEFETGQMVVDKERCGEALEFALWMNQRADFFCQYVWGDKDTFRFAWHKYGLPYAMVPHPIQALEIPGGPRGIGVMCQHDFEGNRIFQHRNMAKWDLLGENPRIPGFLYENECREFIAELRGLWNGRINWKPPMRDGMGDWEWHDRAQIVKDLRKGVWLFEDRRPRPEVCCGPLEKWSPRRKSKPWTAVLASGQSGENPPDTTSSEPDAPHSEIPAANTDPEVSRRKDGGTTTADPMPVTARGLRCEEFGFAKDGTIGRGAQQDFYFWDLERVNGLWKLHLSGEKGRTISFKRQANGDWQGTWRPDRAEKRSARTARLFRVESEYPPLRGVRLQPICEPPTNGRISKRTATRGQAGRTTWHVANHAFGIGDAVTGLYAACQVAEQTGRRQVYHTRLPEWLACAHHSQVEITGNEPPKDTPDMDVDYAEQLRYAPDKVAWYGQWGRRSTMPSAPGAAGKQRRSAGLVVETRIKVVRLDFPRYVVLAPFAVWAARGWPQTHWRRLAWLLDQAGIVPVAIGMQKEAERMRQSFDKSNAYWALDHPPEWVMDAMLGAEAVIGLDSGMVHVAGLLGVPTVCIHAHLPPKFLFSHAPSVRSVTPETKCVFCRWQHDRGFNEGCASHCSALNTVGPEAVSASGGSRHRRRTALGGPGTVIFNARYP